MSDISAIVLKKLLTEQNIELWAKLKLVFLDAAFSNLYGAISRFYDKYGKIPSFEDLELTLRDGPARVTLATVQIVDCEDISADVAMDALLDQYTQNETIKQLDKFIDKLPIYDTGEIKENLSAIVLHLDEKTITTENVYSMNDLMIYRDSSALASDRMPLGLNNKFDAALAGVARQELICLGGKRGSGKSIICSNIQVNEYEMGYVCPYFSIEMVAREVFDRNMAILANVNHQKFKKLDFTREENEALARAKAGMYEDSADALKAYMQHRDFFQLEATLVRDKKLREDAQMIIIDDRALSITSLDLHLGKIKAKFGNKFRKAVVDYLNQIVLDSNPANGKFDQFGWKEQTTIAKKVKDLARKHDIAIFAPYQIDASGEARFGKGILDAADIALVAEAHSHEQKAISCKTTKIRGGADIEFTSPMNWETLRMSPQNIDKPVEGEGERKEKKKIKNASVKENKEPQESATDIPWD